MSLSLFQVAYGQGFGTFKIDAKLQRKRPPQVYILNPKIRIQVSAQIAKASIYTRQMASMLESELINRNNRLIPESANPETIISLDITRLDSDEKWEERRFKRQQKTGERQEWNQKKNKYETKAVYQQVEVRENYKVVTGAINVSYKLLDAKSGRVFDSANFPKSYSSSFLDGNGAPTPNDVENGLVRAVVDLITPRLVPTTETVKVLMAKGKLENASKLGERGLWQRMLEELEMMQPLQKPKDDAYRIYNIAVAYEALAYQSEDLATTKKFLDKAATYYGQAIDMNLDEKHFKEPQLRIRDAITQYRKLDEQIAAINKNDGSKEPTRPIIDPPNPDGGGNGKGIDPHKALTNQDVIDLVNKGLNEINLIETIKGYAKVQFDLSAKGLATLLQNKVSNKVIAVMRARQNPGRKGPTRSGTRKKS
jgi:hypothetical protein